MSNYQIIKLSNYNCCYSIYNLDCCLGVHYWTSIWKYENVNIKSLSRNFKIMWWPMFNTCLINKYWSTTSKLSRQNKEETSIWLTQESLLNKGY